MTARSADKSSARELVSMTGMAYQSCLMAVQVLRGLPAGVDLGDLDRLLAGTGSRPAVLNLPGQADGHYEALLCAPCGPLLEIAILVVLTDGREPTLLARLTDERWGITAGGASLWLELYLGEQALRPDGAWQFSAKRLRDAMAAGAGEVTSVLAEPADEPDGFPNPFDNGFTNVAYIRDRLMTALPSYATPGPGFDWAHLSFSDLGQDFEPDEADHRLVACPNRGNCEYVHDWPTKDPTHTQITLPQPLLRAYQTITSAAGCQPDDFRLEMFYRHSASYDNSQWYGIDFPDFPSRPDLGDLVSVWMRVEPPITDTAMEGNPPFVS